MSPTKIQSEANPKRPATVIITGASSGIGRCTALRFAQHGWRVGLIARSPEALASVRDAIGPEQSHAAPADVTDPDALEAAAAAIEAALGPMTVWVNCAGNGTFGRFLDTPADQFSRVTDVTYLGTVNGTRVALRRMVPNDAGRIVNVCSAVAYHGMPLLASYSGAKHAVRGFGQAIRAELRQDRSRVQLTTLFPPAINTPFFDHAPSHMGRPGRPMAPVYQPEIVAAAIHLAATGRYAEMPLSFTTILFNLATRLVPGAVTLAIQKLDYAGQLTAKPEALARYAPTLDAPSPLPAPTHGAFTDEARPTSRHLWLEHTLARLRGTRPSPTRLPQSPSDQPPRSPLDSAHQRRIQRPPVRPHHDPLLDVDA